jgi:MFS family permease
MGRRRDLVLALRRGPLAALRRVADRFSPNAWLFLLASFATYFTYSGYQLYFNLYILERGFTTQFLGLANALPSVAALVLGLPLGVLADRMGYRRAMLVGLAVSTLALWIQVTAGAPAHIAVMAALVGVGNTLYLLSQSPFMMWASDPRSRAHLFSWNFGLSTLAGFTGNLLAGQLPGMLGAREGFGLTQLEAYQATLVISALGGGLALIPLVMMREPRRTRTPKALGSVWSRLRGAWTPTVVRLAMPSVFIGFGAAILIPYMNLYFKARFEISDARLGSLFSMLALATGLASLASPQLADKMGGKVRAVVVTQGVSVAVLLGMGFSPWFPFAAMCFILRGALMNMGAPLYAAFSMESVGDGERAAANSVLSLSWQTGWAIGPYLSGVVQERWGFAPLFLATAGLYGLGVGLTWVFFRHAEAGRADREA